MTIPLHPELLSRFAHLHTMHQRGAATDRHGHMQRLRHLLEIRAFLLAIFGIGLDAIGALYRVRHSQGDQALLTSGQSAVSKDAAIILKELLAELGTGVRDLSEIRKVLTLVIAWHWCPPWLSHERQTCRPYQHWVTEPARALARAKAESDAIARRLVTSRESNEARTTRNDVHLPTTPSAARQVPGALPGRKPNACERKRDKRDRYPTSRVLQEAEFNARLLGTLNDNDVSQAPHDEQISGKCGQCCHRIEAFIRQVFEHRRQQNDRWDIANRVASENCDKEHCRQTLRIDAEGAGRSQRVSR